ncbi:MAG: ABC transporter permease [Pseudomonadota bacterium]
MKNFRFRRALAIARKEVMHISRDPFTIIVALVIPVFLTIMFGFAIDLDIHDVRLAVFDDDISQTSRIVYQKFTDSKYFQINEISPLISRPDRPLASEHSKVSLIIPYKFEQNLYSGKGAIAQVLLDGSDNTTVNLVTGYVAGIEAALNQQFLADMPLRQKINTVKIVPRFLFNPEQKSAWFIVPGLSVVILAILSILLTALTIAREWETGSMELLLSTPARPPEIILGKLLPYIFLGLVALLFIYTSARLIFGVPFNGSYFAYIGASLLFIGTYLSMGLFISVVAKNQQIAMQMSIMSGYMPSILLSGFIFSIENMDRGWQLLTAILPARWYMTICRACYLKGSSFTDLLVPFSALIILGVVLFFAATKKFKGTLE